MPKPETFLFHLINIRSPPHYTTNRTLSEVDHAEFHSALSQIRRLAGLSKVDFMSAGDQFDAIPGSAGPPAIGDGFDIRDDLCSACEAGSWTSVGDRLIFGVLCTHK